MYAPDLPNDVITKRIQSALRFWAMYYPEEVVATKKYVERLRHGQVNMHGVEGLSKEGNLLAWGFYPGTVYNLLTSLFGTGWDNDKRFQTLFFREFKLGAINQRTEANRDRERAVIVQ